MGPELMDNMRQQAERFGAEFKSAWVESVDFSERPFKVNVEGMGELLAESVIISTGASAKYLGIPGEQENVGRGVSTCATCDGFFFRGKRSLLSAAAIRDGGSQLPDAFCFQRNGSEPPHRGVHPRSCRIARVRTRRSSGLWTVRRLRWLPAKPELKG